MRLSEADGRPVLSRSSAESVGELKHVVVDVAARRITALHVAGRKKKARLVDWARITGFGPDGIVVEDEESTRVAGDAVERAVVAGELDLDGRLVLSDGGDSLGALEDLVFDESDGAIGSIVAGGVEHGAERLRAIGPYCVILAVPPGEAPPPR
jgi:uncharacterized protein YrrD